MDIRSLTSEIIFRRFPSPQICNLRSKPILSTSRASYLFASSQHPKPAEFGTDCLKSSLLHQVHNESEHPETLWVRCFPEPIHWCPWVYFQGCCLSDWLFPLRGSFTGSSFLVWWLTLHSSIWRWILPALWASRWAASDVSQSWKSFQVLLCCTFSGPRSCWKRLCSGDRLCFWWYCCWRSPGHYLWFDAMNWKPDFYFHSKVTTKQPCCSSL